MLYYQMMQQRWLEGLWVSYNDDDDGDDWVVEQRGKSTTLPASSHHTITAWDLERRKENDDDDGDDYAKLGPSF